MSLRSVIVFFLTILLAAAPQPSPKEPGTIERVRRWVYQKLGIDPAIIAKVTATRSGDLRRKGARVMAVQLASQTERVLWACGGCRAPAIAGDGRILVLKDDGIWSVDDSEKARLVVPAQGLQHIVGRVASEPTRVIVLQETSACRTAVRIADLSDGSLLDSELGADSCITMENLVRGDELLNGLLLTSTSKKDFDGPAEKLQVVNVNTGERKSLAPKLDARDPSVDRFDPVWRTHGEAVYLSNP